MNDNNNKQKDHEEKPGIKSIKKSILIVEDDWNSQRYYEYMLSPDYDIFTASTAGSAFSMLQEYSFDLVLMDIMLIGEEDGLSLTRRLRAVEKCRSLPVIAISAYAFPADKSKALEAGCSDFLAKPVKKDDLINMINRYLKR
jgi:two-component system, sensor histidine kinase and response regulator